MEAPKLKKLTPENWLEPEWVMSLFVLSDGLQQ